MKTNHTDEQMQAAIDRACEETMKAHEIYLNALDLKSTTESWVEEKPARLHLLKSALALLPEPPPPVVDGKTPAEIPWIEWHGGECPLKDEEVEEWEWKMRSGKTGIRSDAPTTWIWSHCDGPFDFIAYRVTKWRDGCGPVDWKAKYEKAEAEPARISTLRPISDVGEVPAGCVRYYFQVSQGCSLSTGTLEKGEDDTHCADIRLPKPKEENPASAQPWTPKVGDVVTLKSGGPKMTVSGIGRVEVQVHGFKGESLVRSFLPIATLQPA